MEYRDDVRKLIIYSSLTGDCGLIKRTQAAFIILITNDLSLGNMTHIVVSQLKQCLKLVMFLISNVLVIGTNIES